MFGSSRRRRASNPALNGSNVSANAATAAAQAFLKNRASNASLSSAAAAAALRSRPTTPISVADVQTKRTIRRAESTASNGSAGSGRTGSGRPQLERRGSSGSMSERTFRDLSPARSSQPVPSAVDAPPVPALPKALRPSIPEKSHCRTAILEAPPMRVASAPPNVATGRGSSLGPVGAAQQSWRAGQRNPSLSSLQELGFERPASRGSVNFSLPTSSRAESPLSQRRLTPHAPQRANTPVVTSPTNQNLVYDPNTRSFLPQVEILAIEQRMRDPANSQVKRKKRVAPKQATGTHLAEGTMGGRPRGTAIDAMESAKVRRPETLTPISSESQQIFEEVTPEPLAEAPERKKKRKKKKVVISDSESDQGSYIPNSSDTDSDYATQPAAFNARAGALLAKKPSIVREDREREEEEDDTPKKTPEPLRQLDVSTRTISPSPLPRSAAGRGHGRGQASSSAAFAQERKQTRSASQPAPAAHDNYFSENGSQIAAKGSVKGGRVQSVSPARTTHFAATPDNLVVKHQPPPRSISPRKSALKNSHTPRGASPPVTDLSHGITPETLDELPVPKRRGNRVSFDESNLTVGEAAPSLTTNSPVVQSPQTRRPWYSIGRGKKKETPVVDDDDEIMQPRPALPSFGSVREKKVQRDVTPERPLMQPLTPENHIESVPSPPLFPSPTGEVIESPQGLSNDHIVGAILSQDATSKNTANISKSREPLPPQVTSVEGNGYLSDTDSSSIVGRDLKDSDMTNQTAPNGKIAAEPNYVNPAQPESKDQIQLEIDSIQRPESNNVPNISVTGATPTLESTEEKGEWPDMPGGWHQSYVDPADADDDVVDHHVTDLSPADIGIAEPNPELVPSGSPVIGEIAAENARRPTSAIIEESEDSDANSIYSDAAEDLSDVEGDGFMSLDAVVESPVVPSSGIGTALTTPPDSPTSKATKQRAYRQSQPSQRTSEPDTDEGWDKAQEYWKGLSSDKKRRLELEAQDAAKNTDAGDEVQPAPKPTKKSILKSTSSPVPEIRQPVSSNQRTYMISPGTKHGQEVVTAPASSRTDSSSGTASTNIRKSMRGNGSSRGSLSKNPEPVSERGMRGSMRGPNVSPVEQRGALQKKHRPLSHGPDEIKPDPAAVDALVKKMSAARSTSTPVSTKRASAPVTPALRRKNSGDSDSSFKRARVSTNIPTFKSSMRGSRDEGRRQSPAASSRFSLRTMSPTGSTHRRPFSSAGPAPMATSQTHMRNSMRSSTGSVPTLRGEPSRTKSPLHIPGFGRSSSKQAAVSHKPVPSRTSRFIDSSDDEDARPIFRSRFHDSSDEDEPSSLGLKPKPLPKSMRFSAPVRGIPKRAGTEDGDSSDLPDSDDEKPSQKRGMSGTGNKLVNHYGISKADPPPSNEGGALASGSLRRSGSGRGAISPVNTNGAVTRPGHTRRSSIMSILRRKKPDPNSKIRKSEMESPARRDTPLERSKSDLANIKGSDRPTSPRLQKNPMSRQNSGRFPNITRQIAGGEDDRPFTADTADGVTGAESAEAKFNRPDWGSRRHTATGLSDVDMNGAANGENKPRKKKKFRALRKMFRLDD
ncbi:hypothetical protein BJ875DRAFT_487580 [Amylocarpus encephaloides]|uniref:Uncharacterized protein n=1 Tax=Amylocarpus encephaloides TaxID=45428 RepID=A0A9P8C2E3_9HELO|nr:hypothetical protein BJ875DRAFT_487580 [Amylocarpus encephaloides]